MSIEDELAGLQNDWEKAEAGGTDIPDGNHTFRIETAEVGKSQASGRIQLGMKLKIIVGEHADKVIWNYQGLDNANSMMWLKRNMVKLEVALPDNVTDIPAWCGRALQGITFLANVKNKDGFTNVYPTRRVEVDESGAEDTTAGMGM